MFGYMWGGGNEIAFDKRRYILGTQDVACLDSLHVKPNKNDRSVVIILVDALRNDHLPMYGYKRNTTPFLDSLHKNGQLMVMQNAFSTSTNTVGGVASIFYSRAWENFGYNGLNIMKYLKKVGYTTNSFLTGYHRDWFGLSALYRNNSDYYYESPNDPEIPPDDDFVTLNKFLSFPIQKRSFTYIHLLSTHTIGKKDPAFRKFIPDKIGLGKNKKQALINNYDNGILQADFIIRKIFEKLEKENILSNCSIYILSDHGELFGEDGRWSHGGSIHEKLISIPFLIYDQNKTWYNNLNAATLNDIAPTIIDRLSYPVPACWEGFSLHLPPQDFSVEINSVIETDLPLGIINKQGNKIFLQIMNKKKEIQKIITLTDSTDIDK